MRDQIQIQLAMQLANVEKVFVRNFIIKAVSNEVGEKQEAAMVHELIKDQVFSYAVETGKAVVRMQATVFGTATEYQVTGEYSKAVNGLEMSVGFKRKEDVSKVIIDTWNGQTKVDLTLKRYDASTLH